jgi:hypothetical protein
MLGSLREGDEIKDSGIMPVIITPDAKLGLGFFQGESMVLVALRTFKVALDSFRISDKL